MKRLFAVVLLLSGSALAQTKPAENTPASPKEKLLDAVYVSYFAMRGVMSEEMWRNLKAGAQELEQRDPTDKTGELLFHFISGEIARKSKQFDVAETEFRVANNLNSSDALPFLGLAETALDQGNTDGVVTGSLYVANAVVSKSIPKGSRHLAFERIGELYERAGKFTEAIEAYKAAVRENPTWAAGRSKLAETYLTLNQPSAALPHVQQAISLQPKDAHNYLLLGDAQSRIGQNAAALKAFQKAVDLEPGNALMHYRLGLEYETTGAKISVLHSYMSAKMIAEKNKSYADLLPDLNRAIARLQE
jgi:tetratricopeptide (TPR) repeat protein